MSAQLVIGPYSIRQVRARQRIHTASHNRHSPLAMSASLRVRSVADVARTSCKRHHADARPGGWQRLGCRLSAAQLTFASQLLRQTPGMAAYARHEGLESTRSGLWMAPRAGIEAFKNL